MMEVLGGWLLNSGELKIVVPAGQDEAPPGQSAELLFESAKIKCLFCSTADLEFGLGSREYKVTS